MQIIIRSPRQSGRTTYLVNELLSFIRDEKDLDILVITPVKKIANDFILLLTRNASKEQGYIKTPLTVSGNKVILNDNIIKVLPCFDVNRNSIKLDSYDIIVIDDSDKCDIDVVNDTISTVKGSNNKLLLISEEEK